MKFLILNGANLNRLGLREPSIYGHQTLQDLEKKLNQAFSEHEISFIQSNHEGVLIDSIHNFNGDGIIFNPGAFTHYSIALLDAIKSVNTKVIEVHISNIHSREEFRRKSVIAEACLGQICGLGLYGYNLAIMALIGQK
jgi:3-dehydroquinate dehydratase-2